MGNSNSQIKRGRSQYGSTRSVAFSLPSTWDKRRFSYGEPIHRSRPSSLSGSQTDIRPKPILRNSSHRSNASMSYYDVRYSSSYDNSLRSIHNLSSSVNSLPNTYRYERDSQSTLDKRHSQQAMTSSQPTLTHRQYNDIYLKNDLRRLYKVQDRSSSVAMVDDGDRKGESYNSTASLDRRLFALKNQRHASTPPNPGFAVKPEEQKREGATEKRIKSKKSRKAPLPQNLPGAVQLPKLEGMYKKKRPAPAPPVNLKREKSQSLGALSVGQAQSRGPAPSPSTLLDEIESELANRHNTSISPGKTISIPQPDYDSAQNTPRGAFGKKTSRPKSPPTPVKIYSVSDKTTDHGITSTRAPVPTNTLHVVADVEVHSSPQVSPTRIVSDQGTSTTTDQIASNLPTDGAEKTSLAPVKREVREIAIQYDAPVEIAIQCDGNTLRHRSLSSEDPSRTETPTSLTELLLLFNKAAQVAGEVNKPTNNDDSNSSVSDASSARSRNSANQKIVHMSEVLAGVPTPPPLPGPEVKLIQRRTIKENVPVSLAPMSPQRSSDDISSISSLDSPPKNFNNFHKELKLAYEKMSRRREEPAYTAADRSAIKRQDSDSSDLSILRIYKHAETIIGVTTPTHENESDSGNDEPSDYSSSASQGHLSSKGIPDFVLDDIAKSLPSTDNLSDYDPKDSKNKSKFNSIKRLKKSMKNMLSSISKASSKDVALSMEFENDETSYRDENWTLSGRTKPRTSLDDLTFVAKLEGNRTSTVSSSSVADEVVSPSMSGSCTTSKFEQTTMKSFSLISPTGYRANSKQYNHVSPHVTPPQILAGDETLADIPL